MIEIDLLNTRETATLISLLVAVAVISLSLRVNLLSIGWGFIRSYGKTLVLRALGTMALYMAGCVWILAALDVWRLGHLKTSLVWFCSFALGWLLNPRRWEADPNEELARRWREVVSWTALITFVTEFYTFALWQELILVPVALILSLKVGKDGTGAAAKAVIRLTRRLLATIGWGLIVFALYQLATDFQGFANVNTAREFAVPALLSLMFMPFMYGFEVWAAYWIVGRRLNGRFEQPSASFWLLARAMIEFGPNVKLLRRWSKSLSQCNIRTREGAIRLIEDLKAAARRARVPLPIPAACGWCPEEARKWLQHIGLKAGDYDPRYGGGWGARAEPLVLGTGALADRISFMVAGDAIVVTQARLTLHLDSDRAGEAPQAALAHFAEVVTELTSALYGPKAPEVLQALRSRLRARREGVAVWIRQDDDTLAFVATHDAHSRRHTGAPG